MNLSVHRRDFEVHDFNIANVRLLETDDEMIERIDTESNQYLPQDLDKLEVVALHYNTNMDCAH